MGIYRIKIFLYFIFITRAFPIDCSCCLTEQYFNENILSYPFSYFDLSSNTINPVLYQYEINQCYFTERLILMNFYLQKSFLK